MSEPVFLPLMTLPQRDTAERVRMAVQAIPFALPEKRNLAQLGSTRLSQISQVSQKGAECP